MRPVIELERRADLLHASITHDHDPVGHGHGFNLVVGDVHGRRAQPLMQRLDLRAHCDAQLGIEIRQRLVKKKDLRITHDGAAHRDALALAAGELARIALEQDIEAENVRGLLHAGLDLRGRSAPQPERKAHIGGDRHMGVERVVLEDHRDVALFGRHVVDHAIADADLARRDVLEAGNHPEQCRFAAAGWPDQDDELAVADRDVDAVNDLDYAKGFPDVTNDDRRHARLPGSLINGRLQGASLRLSIRPASSMAPDNDPSQMLYQFQGACTGAARLATARKAMI
jgi:hypothetical protein